MRATVRIVGGTSSSGLGSPGTSVPLPITCTARARAPVAATSPAVYSLTAIDALARSAANAASRGLAPISSAWKYCTVRAPVAPAMAAAAGLVTMCMLSVTCGRSASPRASATALSRALRPPRSAPPPRTLRVRTPLSASKRAAPSDAGATTVVSNASSMPLANRWATTWMPPGAGGKSGVRISRRGRLPPRLGELEPMEAVGPQAQRQQRPQLIAVVAARVRVLTHEALDRLAVEIALLIEDAALELTAQRGRERPAQPLRRRHSEGGLAIGAPAPIRQEAGRKHLVHERLARAGQVHRGVERARQLRQPCVEKGRPDLERDEHARAIGLHEHVVGQVVTLVQVHQPARRRAAVQVARALRQIAEHARAVELGQPRPVQRGAPVAALAGDPIEVALQHGRRRQAPGRPRRRRPARRAPQRPAERVERRARQRRLHATGPFDPAIARVAAEQLVRALAAERDRHPRSRELRERVQRQ